MVGKLSRLIMTAAIAFVMQAASSTTSMAQAWPTRPVRLILPFGPGSGADIAARLLTDKLQALWGQPVVIEGKPGGDGLISIGTVVSAKDDHTLFFGPSSAYVVHPYVHENLRYDPEKDLTPIAGVARVQVAIAVPSSLGLANLKVGDAATDAACGDLYAKLEKAGIDLLYDDRDERTGAKFATADLIGSPCSSRTRAPPSPGPATAAAGSRRRPLRPRRPPKGRACRGRRRRGLLGARRRPRRP